MRYRRSVQLNPTTVHGAENTYTGIMDQLQGFAAREQNIWAQKQQEQARKRGAEENQGSTTLKQVEEPGFFGRQTARQYNQGARDSYLAAVDAENIETISRLEAEYSDDLEGFNKAADEFQKEQLSGIDPAAVPLMRESLTKRTLSARVAVQGRTIAKQQRMALEERTRASKVFYDDAARNARNGDQQASAESLMKHHMNIDSLVDTGDMTAELAKESKRDAQRESTEHVHFGEIDRMETLAAYEYVEDLAKKVPGGFTADEWDAFIGKARGMVGRRMSIEKAQNKQNVKDARARVADTVKALELGMPLGPGEYERTLQDAAMVDANDGTTDAASQLKKLRDAQGGAAFAHMNKAARVASLNTMAGAGNADLLATMQSIDARIEREVREDGYTLAVKQGIAQDVPLNFEAPQEEMNQALAIRIQGANMATEHYQHEVPPMTALEMNALVRNLPKMTAVEKTDLALMLKEAPTVWTHLDKHNAGLFAMAGATGDESVIQSIFEGEEMLRLKNVKPPSTQDALDTFEDYAGGIYAGRDKQAMIQAATAHYAATHGHLEDGFDPDLFQESIEAVSGGIGEVNGGKVELPRGVDEGTFEDFIEQMTPDTVSQFGPVWSYTPEQAAEKIRDATIVSIGQNQYLAYTDGVALYNAETRQPLVISFDAVQYTIDNAIMTDRAYKAAQDAIR